MRFPADALQIRERQPIVRWIGTRIPVEQVALGIVIPITVVIRRPRRRIGGYHVNRHVLRAASQRIVVDVVFHIHDITCFPRQLGGGIRVRSIVGVQIERRKPVLVERVVVDAHQGVRHHGRVKHDIDKPAGLRGVDEQVVVDITRRVPFKRDAGGSSSVVRGRVVKGVVIDVDVRSINERKSRAVVQNALTAGSSTVSGPIRIGQVPILE